MSGIITFINIGFVDNFFQLWFKAFAIAIFNRFTAGVVSVSSGTKNSG